MVARSAITHRSGLRGDAEASIESMSTANRSKASKGQASSSSKMRSKQGIKKMDKKTEHSAAKSTKSKRSAMDAQASIESMSTANQSKGQASSSSKMRSKQGIKKMDKKTEHSAAKSTKSKSSATAASKGTTVKTRTKSVAAKSKSARTSTGSTRTPPKAQRPKKEKAHAVGKESSVIEKSPTKAYTEKNASKKPMTSDSTIASDAAKSRGSTVKISKAPPKIKSVKSTRTILSRLSKPTRFKSSKKAPVLSSTSAETPGRDSFEEEKEEDGEFESEDTNTGVGHTAGVDEVQTDVDMQEVVEEGHESRDPPTRPSSDRRSKRSSKKSNKSKHSGPSRRSSTHKGSTTCADDSTVSTYETRPVPEITLSDVQCGRMLADTYEEMGKYAIKPLGLAVARCACGDEDPLRVHQRSWSVPAYSSGKAPPSSAVGINSIRHHSDCPSNHGCESADWQLTPSSPASSSNLRPNSPAYGAEHTEYEPNGRTEAISAITMPPLSPFNVTVHDQDVSLDQLALQGIFKQYDEFVAELQDMSLEKVKQKAEVLGNTVTSVTSALLQRPAPGKQSILAGNSRQADLNYGIRRNQVTIMTPSEEGQDDWESGHVQLRLTESHQHLTESCEPRNPYARLDAVEVIDDAPHKTFLPPVIEETEDDTEGSVLEQAVDNVDDALGDAILG